MLSPVTHPSLQMFAQPTVVIVSGWGGSGKTQTIGRALQGLSRNINEVGVIINERNEGSVTIDIARLPKGFEKLGLHGCACCSQLADILAGIQKFTSQGRSLTFIEQSPLSITSDLRAGLRQKGHETLVVFAFNPAQFQNASAIHVQGIRDADLVLITHQDPKGDAVQKARRVIAAARGDLSSVPVIVDNEPGKPFPTELWQAMKDIRSPSPQGGLLKKFSGLFGARPQTTTDFKNERSALVANYSEITVRPYESRAEAILEGVKALAKQGIEISRVKGSLQNGVGVDVIQENDRFVLQQGVGVEGAGYLSLRSFKVQLSRHVGEIAASLGTVDSGSSFVRQVVEGYPKETELRESIAAGVVPLGFESDRYLKELRTILPHIQFITDPARQQELGNAFVAAMQASIETRLALVKALEECRIEPPQKALGLFNAYYELTDIFCDPNLQMFARHPTIGSLFDRLNNLNPAAKVLATIEKLPQVRFEGRNDIARDELRLFAQTLSRARDRGFISAAAVAKTFEALSASSDPAVRMHRGVLR